MIPAEGGFDRMDRMHVIAPGGPGACKIRSMDPAGPSFETNATAEFPILFYESGAPDGKWEAQYIVAAAAVTQPMGMRSITTTFVSLILFAGRTVTTL